MSYINRDELMKEFIEFVAPSNRDSSLPIPTWNDAVSLLGSAPDADVVEVVRCKDCKHWGVYDEPIKHCMIGGLRLPVRGNEFCSRGKRRESD